MFQPVQIETQAKQQGLARLHGPAAARRASRKLAFDGREYTLDQSAAPVAPLRKCSPHLGSHSMDAPRLLSALGGNHALRSKLLPDVGVIPLAVEFGVGQHKPDACFSRSHLDNGGQIRTVVPRAATRYLRQQKLLIKIRHDHPFQPVSPRQRFLPVMVHPPHEKCAHRSLRQSGGVHSDSCSPSAFFSDPAQPTYRFPDRPIDGGIVEALQETIQGREVRHAGQTQCLVQFAMLTQAHFGFAKGPVLIAHQAENRQQLWLRKLVFAETAAVAGKHRLSNLQGDASERQESDFGHRASCLHSKQRFSKTYDCEFSGV